jgi:hypothetical protein
MRAMVRETRLSVDSLIYPVFVVPGADVQEEIPSMPGVFHQSVDRLVEDARAVADLGIPALLLFGLPHAKDWLGSQAWAVDGHRPAGDPSDQTGCAVAGRDCRHLPVRIHHAWPLWNSGRGRPAWLH